jgi:hypothetical protein
MASVPPAGPAFFPLDEQLALLPGKLTPQLHGWLVRLSTWMPFARAAQILTEFTQVAISEASARRLTQAAGATYVALQTEEVGRIAQEYPPAPTQPERVVVSADGAMVPLVHGAWAEVKTVAIGEPHAPPLPDEPRVGAISYFSRLADAETFGQQALVEIHRRGVLAAAAVGAVTDGAEWLQGFLDLHCDRAVRILDFAHAAERVSAIGQAVWGEGSAEAATWLQAQLHTLKHQGPQEVLAELRCQQAAHAQSQEIREHLAYLEKRVDQMDYPTYQAAGWPIGSGMVESANKLVVEARLKGSGMHWAREQVNAMLAVRNVECSGRWQEGWTQIQARRRRRVGAVRQARQARAQAAACIAQQARLKAAAPPRIGSQPPRTLGGPPRPGATHPWRRAFQPHMRDRQPADPRSTKC